MLNLCSARVTPDVMIAQVIAWAVLASPPSSVGIDLAAWGTPGQASATMVLSPIVHAELSTGAQWAAVVDWGLVYRHELSDAGAGFAQLKSSNPALAMQRSFDWLGGAWRAGAGVVFPAARLGDGVEVLRRGRNTLGYASGMRANRDLWLWAPERGSLFVPARARWRLPDGWIGGEAALALLTSMGDFARTRTDLVVQAAVAAAWARNDLEGGLRWHVVVVTTQTRERLQWSAAPFFAAGLGRFRVRVELLVPVGDPIASFDLWSLATGVEVTL